MSKSDKAGHMSGLRRIYLILRCILTIVVLAAAIKSCGIVAHADTVLSPEQTIALYGASFDSTWYNKDTGLTSTVTFNCIGRSDTTWMPSDAPNGLNLNIQGFGNVSTANQTAYETMAQTAPFLIYSTTITNYVYNNTTNLTMQFSLPVDLTVTSYNGMFLSSIGSSEYPHNLTSNSNNKSTIIFDCSFDSVVEREVATAYNYVSYMFIPDTNEYSYNGAPPDSDMMHFQIWPGYLNNAITFPNDNTQNFSINGLSVNLKKAAGHVHSFVNPYCTIYFLIQCPTLGNYIPPVVTTTATTPITTTTRSPYTGDYQATTAQFTYDLSPLETNQINQIRIQNEQLQYESGIYDGINIIIQQLNDIYNRMVSNGEIAVDLVGGFDWSINSDINGYINDNLTTFTMTQMDYTDLWIAPLTAYNALESYNFLKPFAVVGLFSIGFGVFCWFLFIGRKGG